MARVSARKAGTARLAAALHLRTLAWISFEFLGGRLFAKEGDKAGALEGGGSGVEEGLACPVVKDSG